MNLNAKISRAPALIALAALCFQVVPTAAVARFREEGALGAMYSQAFADQAAARPVNVAAELLSPEDQPAAASEFTARMAVAANQGYNRAADDAVRSSRQAALDSYRRSVRLEGPGALAQARNEATNWRSASRPAPQDQLQKIYSGWEKKARTAAFEAAEAAYRKGYGRAKLAAKRIAKEYEGKLSREFRFAGLKAMREVFRQGGKDVAARASAAAKKAIADAEAEVAERVAEKLREAERAEFAKLDTEADRQAYQVYLEQEKIAYGWATTTLDLDHGPLRDGVESTETRIAQVEEQVERAEDDRFERGLYGFN